jgi:hypothetical protein
VLVATTISSKEHPSLLLLTQTEMDLGKWNKTLISHTLRERNWSHGQVFGSPIPTTTESLEMVTSTGLSLKLLTAQSEQLHLKYDI